MTAKTHNAAQLLMISAMALPAMADAAEVPDKTDIQYRFTQYQEGDVSPVSGASERYSIDVHQLRVLAPIGGKIAMEVDLVDEVMSGASPWGTQGNEKGEADLIMSGASIAEARRDLSIKFRHYYDRTQWNYHLGSSSENDYQSFYAGTDSELAFNKNNTYLGMGISGSQDFISPTDAELYNRTPSEQKSSASGYLSLSQVLSKNSVAQFGFSFTGYTGYLSDPYKLGDQRPSNKQEQTATLMYRHFLPGPNAALHLDYRFYQDSWQLSSHTMAVRWYQNLGARMQLVPALRYYSQTEAFFTSLTRWLPTRNFIIPLTIGCRRSAPSVPAWVFITTLITGPTASERNTTGQMRFFPAARLPLKTRRCCSFPNSLSVSTLTGSTKLVALNWQH